MIIHLENPKESSRKLLELISKFTKFEEYKANKKKQN